MRHKTLLLSQGKHQAGLTLVELMIAMLLGLLIIGGAVSLLLSNKKAYSANSALGQVQDNVRVAFELMARDIRQTGLTGCGNAGRVGNVLKNGPNGGGTVAWYADIANAVVGYDGGTTDPAVTSGTATAQRLSTTSSLQLVGSDGVGVTVATNTPTASPPSMTINESSTNLQTGDLAVICDPDHAAILQISQVTKGASISLAYDANAGSPGNCSSALGFPTQCTGGGNAYTYQPNAQVGKLYAADWYVGYNPLGGTSLYRKTLVNVSGVPTPQAQEMVRGVTDMQIAYNMPQDATYGTTFVSAATVGTGALAWSKVAAAQVTLKMASSDQRASSKAQPITIQAMTTIALRNRL